MVNLLRVKINKVENLNAVICYDLYDILTKTCDDVSIGMSADLLYAMVLIQMLYFFDYGLKRLRAYYLRWFSLFIFVYKSCYWGVNSSVNLINGVFGLV